MFLIFHSPDSCMFSHISIVFGYIFPSKWIPQNGTYVPSVKLVSGRFYVICYSNCIAWVWTYSVSSSNRYEFQRQKRTSQCRHSHRFTLTLDRCPTQIRSLRGTNCEKFAVKGTQWQHIGRKLVWMMLSLNVISYLEPPVIKTLNNFIVTKTAFRSTVCSA